MVPTELSEALAVRTEAEKTISRYTAKIARDLEYAKVRIALTHKGEYVVLLEGNWTGKVQHQALADYYKMRTCDNNHTHNHKTNHRTETSHDSEVR